MTNREHTKYAFLARLSAGQRLQAMQEQLPKAKDRDRSELLRRISELTHRMERNVFTGYNIVDVSRAILTNPLPASEIARELHQRAYPIGEKGLREFSRTIYAALHRAEKRGEILRERRGGQTYWFRTDEFQCESR